MEHHGISSVCESNMKSATNKKLALKTCSNKKVTQRLVFSLNFLPYISENATEFFMRRRNQFEKYEYKTKNTQFNHDDVRNNTKEINVSLTDAETHPQFVRASDVELIRPPSLLLLIHRHR